MTSTRRNRGILNGVKQADRALHSLEGKDELELFDRQAGHQYVPMDIYIDPGTINEHFHASSIRRRWARFHRSSS